MLTYTTLGLPVGDTRMSGIGGRSKNCGSNKRAKSAKAEIIHTLESLRGVECVVDMSALRTTGPQDQRYHSNRGQMEDQMDQLQAACSLCRATNGQWQCHLARVL